MIVDFDVLLADLNLTQTALAKVSQLNPRTLRRYISGECAIPPPTLVLWQLLRRHPHLVKELTP